MSARRKPSAAACEVLPPDRTAKTAVQVRVDAQHLRVVAALARNAIAETKVSKVVAMLKRQAEFGALDAIVKFADQENWRAAIWLEAVAASLHALGFFTRTVMVPHQSSYSQSEVPALHVSWAGGPAS